MSWSKCSTCGKAINYGQNYYKCSVSTCRRLDYCSDTCWDVHSPAHRSAYAEEERAPAKEGQKRLIKEKNSMSNSSDSKEVLIVASKLKAFVKNTAQLNTSGGVMDPLSDLVRVLVLDAMDKAKAEGRKTLLDRDFMGPEELQEKL